MLAGLCSSVSLNLGGGEGGIEGEMDGRGGCIAEVYRS